MFIQVSKLVEWKCGPCMRDACEIKLFGQLIHCLDVLVCPIHIGMTISSERNEIHECLGLPATFLVISDAHITGALRKFRSISIDK